MRNCLLLFALLIALTQGASAQVLKKEGGRKGNPAVKLKLAGKPVITYKNVGAAGAGTARVAADEDFEAFCYNSVQDVSQSQYASYFIETRPAYGSVPSQLQASALVTSGSGYPFIPSPVVMSGDHIYVDMWSVYTTTTLNLTISSASMSIQIPLQAYVQQSDIKLYLTPITPTSVAPGGSITYKVFVDNLGTNPVDVMLNTFGSPYNTSIQFASNWIRSGSTTTMTIIVDPSHPGSYYENVTVVAETMPMSGMGKMVTADAWFDVAFPSNVSFSYPAGNHCPTGSLLPTINDNSGYFTGDAGLAVDTYSGVVDLALSLPGVHTVNYYQGYPSYGQYQATVTVLEAPRVTYFGTAEICSGSSYANASFQGDPNTLFNWTASSTATGLPASGTGTLDAYMAYNNSNGPLRTTLSVTPYTANGCTGASFNHVITVKPIAGAAFSYNGPVCGNSFAEQPVFSGTTGGNFTSTAGLSINASSGKVYPYLSTPGSYTITYTVSGACGAPAYGFITINPVATTASILNKSVTGPVCAGSEVLLTQTGGTLAPNTYWQWYTDAAMTQPVGSPNGLNNAQITVAPTQTTTYYLQLRNNSCGAPNLPSSASVTVQVTALSASISVANSQLCSGGGSTTVLIANGPASGTAKVLTNGGSPRVVTLDANGAGSFATGVLTTNTTYALTLVSNGSCNTVSTNTASVFVNSLAANPVPNQVVCAGTSTAPIAFGGFAPGTQYSWTNSNTAIGLAASGTGTSLPAFMAAAPGNTTEDASIVVRPIPSNSECPVGAITFRYRVQPTPVAAAIATQALCAGTAIPEIVFSGTLAGTTYSWTNNNTATGFASSGTGNIAASTVQNNTGTLQISQFAVTPRYNACTGTPVHFNIAVSAAAGAISYPQVSYCTTGWAYATRTGSAGGNWTAVPNGLVLNPATGAINLALSAPGSYTVSYSVSSSASCAAVAMTLITIKSDAVVDPVPNQIYCAGMTTTPIVFTGSAASYSWTNSDPTNGLPASGTGNIPSFSAVNAGPTAKVALIRVVPNGNGNNCSAKQMAFYLTVNNCPPVTVTGPVSRESAQATAISSALQVSVGPNPATTTVTIDSRSGRSLSVRLLDAFGRPVLTPRAFTGRTTLSLAGIVPGAYLVQVSDTQTGELTTQRLIKL
ncbi:MAG: T9SS type A sorting domain-containing protein [Chitinophagaceae bacterium]|nr:MAG: T9SS type A sorting domain-containing protein [Chitinophagaceae bacterium]